MDSLGIDIGGTSVKLAALRDGQKLWTGQSPLYSRPTTEQLLGAMRAAAGGREVRAAIAGLCVPGLLDKATRTITLAVNVPGLVGVPLNELVDRAFGNKDGSRGAIGRIQIINDAVAAASDLAAARGLRGRLLALAIGTGVGAAVLDDGVPLMVEGESPGHIGQLDVSIPGADVIGPDGGAGSLEGYLGAPVLRDRYGEGALEKMRIEDPAASGARARNPNLSRDLSPASRLPARGHRHAAHAPAVADQGGSGQEPHQRRPSRLAADAGGSRLSRSSGGRAPGAVNRSREFLAVVARHLYNRRTMPISTKPPQRHDDASDPEPRHLTDAPVDIPRIERAVREILLAVGEDPDREGLLKTPTASPAPTASCCGVARRSQAPPEDRLPRAIR
jgi:predicted NBD/HSP70 family sugar kinase